MPPGTIGFGAPGQGIFHPLSQPGVVTPSPYETEVRADSPAAYYRLGEASGNPQDSSANGNNVTVVGGTPTYGVAGAISGNTAVTLNGTTGYFTAPDHATLDLGDVVTLEAWIVRGAAGANRGIVSKGQSAYYLRLDTSGNLQFLRSQVANIVTSTVAVPTTGWHHVVATKNGATVKLYIDAVDVTGTVTDSTLINNALPLHLGADHDGALRYEYFNGSVDEIAVYPTALSAARVLAHYAAAALPARTASVEGTGGGTATVVGSRNTDASVTATGGGIATVTVRKAAAASVTATGGGIATVVATSARTRSVTGTGGGTAVVTDTGAHRGSVTATGGGTATVVATSARLGSVTSTGGGTATISATAARSGSATGTGGGIATLAGTAGRRSSITATGGGIATVTGTASGGGSSAEGSVTATGGGIATISARANRRSSVTATGGGASTVTGFASRRASVTGTGGGIAVITWSAAHNRSIVATGGGVAVITWTGAHFGSVVGTGGGTATVRGGRPFPRDATVTIALAPGITGTIVFGPARGPVTVELDDAPTAEVVLT